MRKIVGLSGSLRRGSYSTALLTAFAERALPGYELEIADISQVPMFDEDLETDEPGSVVALKRAVADAAGVLLVTPEYNRSYTPVLKNALDWGSRPKVAVGTTVWSGKPVALAGCSPYSLGAAAAVYHLRQVLVFLNMIPLQQPEFYMSFATDKFDEAGKLIDQPTIEHMDAFWAAFVQLIERNDTV